MKKYLLLSIFGLLISISAYSQETDEKVFPESDAIWSIYEYTGRGGGMRYIYGLSGDTIINEKHYNKLYLLNDSTLNIDENDIYVGGVRQKNKIIYLQPEKGILREEVEEFILYDFSKKIGEEVVYYRKMEPWVSNLVQVRKTIKTEEQTKYGRLLAFEEYQYPIHNIIDCELDCWVEGIGSLNGLFFPRIDYTLCGNTEGGQLICMKENGEIKYFSESWIGGCFSEIDVSVSEDQIVKIRPKYNPLNKTIELSDIESLYLPYTFSVINLEGKTLISYTIAESNTNINASHLHSGVYIYSLSGDNIKHTGKIMIQ